MAGHAPLRAWHGRRTRISDKTDVNLAMWHTRLAAGCWKPAFADTPLGIPFMIVGQKWRIAPLTSHDHEKPRAWRGKLSPDEANVRAQIQAVTRAAARTDLAREFSVSESTVSRAKRLLAAAKILTSLTRHPGLIAIRGAIAPENAIKPGWGVGVGGWGLRGWGWGLRGWGWGCGGEGYGVREAVELVGVRRRW